MSMRPMALATISRGMKSAMYRSEMYPHSSTPAVLRAAPKTMIRERPIWPTALRRKAVTTPQQLSRKSNGMVAGMLAVG